MGFATPAPAAHRPEWRALLALACTAVLCALALLVAGRAADQPTTSTKGAQVKAKATAYMNGQPGFIVRPDATAFESINFITASSGQLSFSFLDEALRGGKCHAISKATGKPISGRMHMLDENDNRTPTVASGQGMRVNFGTTLSYFRTVCDFEESVDAKKEASVSFGGGVSGKIMLALKPMFVGKPAGLAMCQPGMFPDPNPTAQTHVKGPDNLPQLMELWTGYISKQEASAHNKKPVRFYSFDLRHAAEKKAAPIAGATEVTLPAAALDALHSGRDRSTGGDAPAPFYHGQHAWIHEGFMMAKYDGYKWAGFMDNDEYPTLKAGGSMMNYLEATPEDVNSVVVLRRQEPAHEGGYCGTNAGLGWEKSPMAHLTEMKTTFERFSTLSDDNKPPKYYTRVDTGEVGSIHLPRGCAHFNDPSSCTVPTRWGDISDVMIRHIPGLHTCYTEELTTALKALPNKM